MSTSSDEVERLSSELGMRLYRTSVKEDLNVGSVFQHLAENYVAKLRNSFGLGGYDALVGNGGGGGGISGSGFALQDPYAEAYLPTMQVKKQTDFLRKKF